MHTKAHTDETLKQLMNEMQKKFNKYWSQCNNLLVIASILDPRQKLIFVEFCYKRAFDPKEKKKRIEEIHLFLHNIYSEYTDAAKVQ